MDSHSTVFSARFSESAKANNESSLVYLYLLAGITLFISVSIFLPRIAGG